MEFYGGLTYADFTAGPGRTLKLTDYNALVRYRDKVIDRLNAAASK